MNHENTQNVSIRIKFEYFTFRLKQIIINTEKQKGKMMTH